MNTPQNFDDDDDDALYRVFALTIRETVSNEQLQDLVDAEISRRLLNAASGVIYRTVLYYPCPTTGWRIPVAVVVESDLGPIVGIASFLPDSAALGSRARQTLLAAGLELLRSQLERADELPASMGPHFALSHPVVSTLAKGAEDRVGWLVAHMLPTKPERSDPSTDNSADALLGQAPWSEPDAHAPPQPEPLQEDGHTWFGVYLEEYPDEGVMGPYRDRAEAEAAGRELGDPVVVVPLSIEQSEELSKQEMAEEEELGLWCVDTGNEDLESRYFFPVPDRRIAEGALESARKAGVTSDGARVRRCRRIRLSDLKVEQFAHEVAESIREIAGGFIVPGYGDVPKETWAIWDDEIALVDERALARAMPAFLKVKAFVCEDDEAQDKQAPWSKPGARAPTQPGPLRGVENANGGAA